MSLEEIIKECDLTQASVKPVHGGDINKTFCITLKDRKYFLKVNSASLYPGMFDKESKGLKALAEESEKIAATANLSVPAVYRQGIVGGSQYLLLEWIEAGRPGKLFWENFGRSMALLHQQVQPFNGWTENNFIGSLVQDNTPYQHWHSFFTECRVLPLVKNIFDSGSFSKRDLEFAERFCKRCEDIFPREHSSLLHGDLWSGNYLVTGEGTAAIFDPAVYFGHREMDIAMTKLFGGFDTRFYAAYHEQYPLSVGWQERLPIAQLYPLLVHAVLFGGHYVNSARTIIHQFR